MNHLFRTCYFSIVFNLLSCLSNAQNVSVSGALTGNGSYADLYSAFVAINASSQPNASISISILANTTETTAAVLNSGSWNLVTITPVGTRTISGNIAGVLVDLNGADHVLIDGLNTGGNSLVFSNTNTGNVSTATIRLMADATSNTITNCSILGSSTSSVLGTVTYTLAGVLGNSNNVLSNCDIGPAGTNYPANSIFSIGNSGFTNSSNSVVNCSIYDYMSFSQPSSGILLSSFNTGWSLQGNRFFQTSARNYTNTSTENYHAVIKISSGNGYTLTNNVIGYSSAAGTGTYAINTNTNAYVPFSFTGIDLSVGNSPVTSIQGNTITAIHVGGEMINSAPALLRCIGISSGKLNIGDVSGNVFGGTSGTDLITCRGQFDSPLRVIHAQAPTATVNIQNNIIGGISNEGINNGASCSVGLMLIVADQVNVSGNIIGNSTPDNIRAGKPAFTTGPCYAWGFHFNYYDGKVSVTSNTFQNISVFGSGEYNTASGIRDGGFSGGPTYTVSGNLVRNIKLSGSTRNQGLGQQDIGAVGISQTVGSNVIVSNNTVTAISIVGASAMGCNAAGIHYGNADNGTITANYISDITNNQGSTALLTPPVASGIHMGTGTGSVIAYNNFISLGTGNTDNTTYIGIFSDNFWSPTPVHLIYHNTINIEGTVSSGANPSFGYYRGSFGKYPPAIDVYVKNNLITNSRSGGFGAHFAIANDYGSNSTSTAGWPAGRSNNNILNATFSVAVAYWGGNLTFANWQTTSGGDGNSFSGVPVTYVNSAANDLHINMGTTPTNIESKGMSIPGITMDIDNQSRPGPAGSVNGGGLSPDIGADEIDGVLLDMDPPLISFTNLATACASSDRTIQATISDFLGVPTTGSLQPRIYFNKNAGSYFSSQGVLSSGTALNGVWTFTLLNSAMGGVSDGDVISYFITAQDVSPMSNISASPATGFSATTVNNVTNPPAITSQTFTVKITPSISVNSGSICSNASFTIVPSGASTYSISGNSFTVSPPAGITTYSITGSGVSGCISGNTAIASLTVYSTPTISVNNPVSCDNANVVIVPAGAATYTISGNTFTVSPPVTTSYSITGSSTEGCTSSNTAISTVMADATPTISVSDYTICSGHSVVIVPGGAHTYSITGAAFSVSPTSSTSYTISGSSIGGCLSGNTAVSSVSVNITPTVTVNSGSICAGASFTITPVGAVSYSVTNNSFIVSPLITSTYSVQGTSANGCISSPVLSTVTVHSPVITVNSASVCAGNSVAIVPSGALTYTITGSTFTVSPGTTTSYSVSGTDTQGCVSAVAAISTISVIPLPTVMITSPSPTLCVGESITLSASGAFTYTWNTSQVGTNISITPTTNTMYSVTGTAINGCKNSISFPQYVDDCTGIREEIFSSALSLNVYPNPNQGEFTIDCKEPVNVVITDLSGRIVFSEKSENISGCISIKGFAPGVYLIKSYSEKRAHVSKLIVK